MARINRYKNFQELESDVSWCMAQTLDRLGLCDIHTGHVTDNNISPMIGYHYWQVVEVDEDEDEHLYEVR